MPKPEVELCAIPLPAKLSMCSGACMPCAAAGEAESPLRMDSLTAVTGDVPAAWAVPTPGIIIQAPASAPMHATNATMATQSQCVDTPADMGGATGAVEFKSMDKSKKNDPEKKNLYLPITFNRQ